MTRMARQQEALGGIPGKITETSLTFTEQLDFETWANKLELLGRIGGSIQWWIADAINWGANRFGEEFAQGLDRLSTYAPQTLLNIAYVGRTFLPSDRRGLPLTFSHHATVAGIEGSSRTTWLDRAQQGDVLPNGETRPWSVTRLRSELRSGGRPRAAREEVCCRTLVAHAWRIRAGLLPHCPSCTCGAKP